MQTITIELRPEDAEPILREQARRAAYYGGRWLYVTRHTHMCAWGMEGFDVASKRWHHDYLAAERMVEAFGVEADIPSEAETMTITHPMKNEKRKVVRLPGIGPVRWRSGGEPDYKRPQPCYRGGVHEEACKQAADRVVRRWRAKIENEQAAA